MLPPEEWAWANPFSPGVYAKRGRSTRDLHRLAFYTTSLIIFIAQSKPGSKWFIRQEDENLRWIDKDLQNSIVKIDFLNSTEVNFVLTAFLIIRPYIKKIINDH